MAKTCSRCGFAGNNDRDEECLVCRSRLGNRQAANHAQSATQPPFQPNLHSNEDTARWRGGFSQVGSQPPSAQGLRSGPTDPPNDGGSLNNARGRVSHIDRYDEPAPPTIFKPLSYSLLIVLFGIPIAAVSLALGILSLSFAIIGFAALSRFFNPYLFLNAVWRIIEVFVLGGIGRVHTIPVYRGMIETREGAEFQFLFYGPIEYGNLVVGHHVSLSGKMRSGTLIVAEGYDDTVGSAITSRFRNRWKIFFFILLAILIIAAGVGLNLHLHTQGKLPWL